MVNNSTNVNICFVLDQHTKLDFANASSLKKLSMCKTCHFTLTHYHDYMLLNL